MADHAPRPDPGLRAAPRLRPAALRPVRAAGGRRGRRARRRRSARCSTPPRRAGATVVALSEYGITDVARPGRRQPGAARRGPAARCYTQAGMEYLDPWTSRAFAVADHQVAHVYVARPGRPRRPSRSSAPACPGWPRCSTTPARPRTASTTRAPASWCWSPSRTPGSPTTTGSTTPRAPDFARLVEIHRKPGYDPAELFFDPAGPGAAKRRAGARAGSQEARHALPDERGRPRRRRRARSAARTAGCRPTRDDAPGAALLATPRPRAGPDRRHRGEGAVLLGLAGLGGHDRRRLATEPSTAEPARAASTRRWPASSTGRTRDWPDGAPRGVLDALRRFVLAGGKRLRPMFCYWGWRGAGGADDAGDRHRGGGAGAVPRVRADPRRHHGRQRPAPRRSRRCTGSSPTCTPGTPGAATRPRSAATPPCSAATCARPGPTRCSTSAGCRPRRSTAGTRLFALMRTEVIAGQYLDLVSGVGRRLGGRAR